MALISMQGVTLNLGGKTVLRNADFFLEPGERVCLMGRNGAGKSSLLSLLSGQRQPDSGIVVRGVGAFGHMPQDVPASWQGTVFAVTAMVLGPQGAGLAAAYDATTAGLPCELSQEGWEYYGEVLGVINRLGLTPEADFASLSGGTKRRVALARALLGAEDLLLDEPTNHLDIETVTWLEDFLLRRARSLVFVSHDRAFIQRLATRFVEVDRGGVHSYACTYDQYEERREARLDAEERAFALHDKKLAAEEVWIRQGIKARRTRNMGRVRALQRLRGERAARQQRQGNVVLQAQEAARSGSLVLEAENLGFAYPGEKPLFTGFSTVVQRGDKIGLVGANGAGKTTLLRLLLGELEPSHGSVRLGTRLEVAYFDQMRAGLNASASVMDSVADGNDTVVIGGKARHVAGYLQDFLFTPDRLRLPVGVLSGGERNRLLLARLFTRPSNVLVLDEPTNDLDMETLELLEELLGDYNGTVLLVSHDRRFLDNLVTSVFALEGDGAVHEYVGAYTDWLRQRRTVEAGNASAKSDDKNEAKPALGDEAKRQGARPRKLSFNEQRELTKLGQELEALPGLLHALEEEQAQLEAQLAVPDFFTKDEQGFHDAAARLEAVEAEQTALLERWEFVEARLTILDGA
ncbi:ATP-binding cassette domain-containing protein [Desulfovibrio cuneatus]|uniref:ATP-binding cassette domain-containing protein n=1 Tax=Desulfovibrio cuneatus TaxID=159728 RepID=UPI000482F6CB|nr:ATP-binding cassette domain-containing protein [Desulfovibrio cuneatus]